MNIIYQFYDPSLVISDIIFEIMKKHNSNDRVSIHDPISTPARRRRLTADFTRTLVRKYYNQSCINVKKYRIERYAAIIIQCLIRKRKAIRKLIQLRYIKRHISAIIIQKNIRMMIAKRKRWHLYYIWRYKLQYKIALNIQTLFRIKLSKKIVKQIKIKKENDLTLLKHNSAIIIQKHFRGMIERIKYKKLIDLNNKYKGIQLK